MPELCKTCQKGPERCPSASMPSPVTKCKCYAEDKPSTLLEDLRQDKPSV